MNGVSLVAVTAVPIISKIMPKKIINTNMVNANEALTLGSVDSDKSEAVPLIIIV